MSDERRMQLLCQDKKELVEWILVLESIGYEKSSVIENLKNEIKLQKSYYYQLADAIACESSSVEELVNIARKTRLELNNLRDENRKLESLIYQKTNIIESTQ